MWGSTALEVAIGLALVYSFLSLICSTLQEWIASAFNWRANDLEKAIRGLLNESDAFHPLTDKIYSHGIISGLTQEDRKPAYIPGSRFSQALTDVLFPVAQGGLATFFATGTPALKSTLTAAYAAQGKAHPLPTEQAITKLLSDAGPDLKKAQDAIAKWFDDAMDRASGLYKRYARRVVTGVAAAIVLLANIDTISIGSRLLRDPSLRSDVINSATDFTKKYKSTSPASLNTEFPEAAKKLTEALGSLGIPLGWPDSDWPANGGRWAKIWFGLDKTGGLILTIIAISLGAPFWFDLLSKLVNVRATGRKPDSNKEDA